MKRYWHYLKVLCLYLTQKTLGLLEKLCLNPTVRPKLNKLNTAKHYRLDIGHPDRIVILLVGVGGTGSWCAHAPGPLAGQRQPGSVR